MNYQIAISRLLAIVLIAGLVLGPLTHPVMAGLSSRVSMQVITVEKSPTAVTDEMASGMPCCPSQAPVECDKCMLLAICMAKCFTGMATIVVHPSLFVSSGIALRRKDFTPDGLGHPPPEHPPRTLV